MLDSNKINNMNYHRENGSKKYTFLDGPPFINGKMHHGHALVSSIKDTILKHKQKAGHHIDYMFGFDEHGLPMEQAVEKIIGKIDPSDTDQLKLFCKTSRDIIQKYTKEWMKGFDKLGRQYDPNFEYHTSSLEYMNCLWENFNKLYEKGLIYKSYKVMPYSPSLGCSLSNFEANSNYQKITDNSIYVKFPVKQNNEILENTYFLVWTTTPWSLVGNMGLGVNLNLNYFLIKFKEEKYFIAENLVESNFKEFELINVFTGKEIINNFCYQNIYSLLDQVDEIDYKFYSGDFITDTAGTGIVHLAPMFGDEDFKTINNKDLPIFLDINLNFNINYPELEITQGKFLLDIEVPVIINLKKRNLLFKKKKIQHDYPMCWRTDTKLIYYATTSWFLNVTKIKDDLVKCVKQINWHPNEVAENRFNNWVKNAKDWCLSRTRIWGTPLPIWVNEDDYIFVKSKDELENLTNLKFNDLHLDSIKDVEIIKNNKKYKLMGDVFDCWYESGMACVFHQNSESDTFEPFDFITESIDQTRGWFYTLNVLSTALYKKPAFKNVKVSGLILASDGKKMSKRLQNYTDPLELIDEYGSDILRLYLISSPASKGESFNFNDNDLKIILKKFIPLDSGISLLNQYGIKYENPNSLKLKSIDKWVIYNINEFNKKINDKLNNYDTSNLEKLIFDIIDKICNKYIRLCRNRLNYNLGKEEYNNCIYVLSFVLTKFIDTIEPIIPRIHQYFKNKLIIKNNTNLIADNNNMDYVFDIIEKCRKLRSESKFTATFPIKKSIMYLPTDKIELVKDNLNYIVDENNIELIELFDTKSQPFILKPVRGKIGKVFKKDTGKIIKLINSINTVEGIELLKSQAVTSDMYRVIIQPLNFDNCVLLNEDNMVIYFDILKSEDIIKKEYLTQFKKHINSVKKDKKINWYDNIVIEIENSNLIQEYKDYLKEKLFLKFVVSENKSYDYKYNDLQFNL